MTDKPIPFNKKDIDIILETNRKAIEIETEVSEQNEEIIDILTKSFDKQTTTLIKLEKLEKTVEDTAKSIFEIKVLFIVGILGILGQIIQIFLKK